MSCWPYLILKLKDVFDERRRITCFSIWQRALSCPSPRTDPETSSGWPSTLGYRHLLYRRTEETDFSLYVWCLYRARWYQKGQLSKRKKNQYIRWNGVGKPLPIPVLADGKCVGYAWIPRVQEPAAIRPLGHRVFQTPPPSELRIIKKASERREVK